MDVLYEECAVNHKAARDEKLYKIMNVGYFICLMISIISLLGALLNMPFGSTDGLTGDALTAYQYAKALFSFSLLIFFPAATGALMLFLLKRRVNINYDYTFVSGELRIVKVFNVNRRKLVTKIQPEEILQLGDLDNESYNRLAANSMNKQVICTPNAEPMNGKFFMYVHATEPSGNKLYVLE